MVGATAFGAVDSGLILSWVKPMTLKLVFTLYQFTFPLLDVEHSRDSVENKPASLLVVWLGKAQSGIPSLLCGRQVQGDRQLLSELVIAF